MSYPRPLLISVLALVTAACAEGTDPLSPDNFAAVVDAPGHRVAGSGHVQSAAGLREFTFHAVESPDGSVDGSYKVVLANGIFLEADVTCLAVLDGTGWVAGTIRATNTGAVVVGSRSMFFAIDGGEGSGAGDRVSLVTFNGPEGADLEFCEEKPLVLPQLEVTDGNVQVR